jgi:hypothetical protein
VIMGMGTPLLSKPIASLALNLSEIALIGFGLLLVFGLIGEYRESDKWKRWVKAFELMVIIGVAGELLADGGIYLFSSSLQTISDIELAQLNKEAGEARKSAGEAAERAATAESNLARAKADAESAKAMAKGFELRIAQANKQAAEANRIAEGERLARKKIEERLADRSLTDAQLRAIANKLKRFTGQEFRITTYWDSKEPLSLANRIYAALNLAGWKYLKHEKWTGLFGGVEGVLVYVHPAADERTRSACEALISALIEEGISSGRREKNDPQHPDNTIDLNVGAKP